MNACSYFPLRKADFLVESNGAQRVDFYGFAAGLYAPVTTLYTAASDQKNAELPFRVLGLIRLGDPLREFTEQRLFLGSLDPPVVLPDGSTHTHVPSNCVASLYPEQVEAENYAPLSELIESFVSRIEKTEYGDTRQAVADGRNSNLLRWIWADELDLESIEAQPRELPATLKVCSMKHGSTL